MAQYGYGQTITLKNTWKVLGTLTDPTTVTLWIKTPQGTETEYTYADDELTKVSTGVFKLRLRVLESGTWFYHWKGTGVAQQDSGPKTFTVGPNPITAVT